MRIASKLSKVTESCLDWIDARSVQAVVRGARPPGARVVAFTAVFLAARAFSE